MRLIVTGGTGFLGQNLKYELNHFRKNEHYKFYDVMWLDKSYRLEDRDLFEGVVQNFKPEFIIHLAGRVGGIQDNAHNQKEFLETNILINTNVIRTADKYEIPTISMSSSCCYPVYPQDRYPLKEKDFYIGNFEPTNYSYALAKGVMMKQVELSQNQHICLIPCNLFGMFDHFGKAGAHFIPSMITKIVQAQREGKKKITLLGDGTPMRQFCDAMDVAELILKLTNYNPEAWAEMGRFVNVAPRRNVTIKEAAETIRDEFAPDMEIEFDGNTKYNGVHRKDISDDNLQNFFGVDGYSFEYTPFKETIREIKNDKNLVIP